METEYLRTSSLETAWVLLKEWIFKTGSESKFLLVTPSEEEARTLRDDIETLASNFFCSLDVRMLPTWSHDPYSQILPSIEVRLERLSALTQSVQENSQEKLLIITTGIGACQATLPPKILAKSILTLRLKSDIENRESFTQHLISLGYSLQDPVEDRGTFCVRGELIDCFPPHLEHPIRIELFDTLIERIRHFDPKNQRTLSTDLNQVILPPSREVFFSEKSRLKSALKDFSDTQGISRSKRDPILSQIENGIYPTHSDLWVPFIYPESSTIFDYFSKSSTAFYHTDAILQQAKETLKKYHGSYESKEIEELIPPPPSQLFIIQALDTRPGISFNSFHHTSAKPLSVSSESIEANDWGHLKELTSQGFKVTLFCATQTQADRATAALSEHEVSISVVVGEISKSSILLEEKVAFLSDTELFGITQRKRKFGKGETPKGWSGLLNLTDLEMGDPVVHADHGIGLYQGLHRLKIDHTEDEFLLLEYAAKDKLYLPVYRLNIIQKYFGTQESVALDKLGGPGFQKTKGRVQEEVRKIAFDLLRVYAERSIRPGPIFPPRDRDLEEFESKFQYVETADQARAIDDTLQALHSGKIMDRIVCGDVGFGKTEVAIRAAFRVISSGKQVAVLVPTTLLAHQHEQTFKTRFKDYPFIIDSVFRFKSAKKQKQTLEDTSKGKVDIIIGTHRLLSKDVDFHDLGLLIIDEEHRFGVEQKEKIKALRTATHVLSLTATPIPRTLQMSLSGLRDISIISTPPVNRLPIRTYVSRYSDELAKTAIETELARGGQTFFVHNRVQGIEKLAAKIRELVPHARVLVGHAQMSESELERVMLAFYQKEADVLICTTIIESGLDIPSANTILVHRADTFGLSQLYQIRGRVGRGDRRAYAYLFLPEEGSITSDARRRLEVLQRFVELGSGFSIASHDLEIRGGGELLGANQSGHMGSVGFEMYTQMLEEAIGQLKGERDQKQISVEPEIKTPYSCFLPENFISDVHQRLGFYRRLSASPSESDLVEIEKELQERFGKLPDSALQLLWLIRIKQRLKKIAATHLIASSERFSITLSKDSPIDLTRAISQMTRDPKNFIITPDSKIVCFYRGGSIQNLSSALDETLHLILNREALH